MMRAGTWERIKSCPGTKPGQAPKSHPLAAEISCLMIRMQGDR